MSAAAAVALWLLLSLVISPRTSDNPQAPGTAIERAKEEAQLRLNAYDAKRRRYWIEQVQSGEMSFEEAGCGYRGGEWQSEIGRCDMKPIPGAHLVR